MTHLNVRGGSGNIIEAQDNVRPQDNLYLAVNSAWIKQAEIPSDRSRISSFDGIDLNVEKALMADFAAFADGQKAISDVPTLDKAVAFYRLARDFKQRNEQGAKPLQEDLKELLGIESWADFNAKAAKLALNAFTIPFDVSVDADMKNTKQNLVYFSGPRTILPDTTTYQADGAEQLLAIYEKQTTHLLQLAGLAEAEAAEYAKGAIAFDRKIAGLVKSTEEWADYPAMYNPISWAEFAGKFTEFDIASYFEGVFAEKPERVINTDPRFLDHVNELISSANFTELKGWLLAKFINGAASSLSQEFREAAFPYHQALTGQPELAAPDKQAYHLTNSLFSEPVGVYYGQTYFGKEAKADVLDMIHKMLAVYEERITHNSWLSEATKEKAIVKLRALILKVGYPDKIEELYYRYRIISADQGGSVYSNLRAAAVENIKYEIEKLHKPVDRTVWLMPGNLVNACYDPQRNDLTFPAAILQAPFYDLKQGRSENFGGIGTVIAHEVSHAFDNNGAQFDEYGNMVNWWTDADYAEFKKRTQAEIALFDGIQYGPVKLNGKQIVSENIADQGGLTAAVQAAKNEGDDLKPLFENFARVWANKQLTEAIKTQVAVDVHAPGPERANVQSQCQDDFYEAFDVKPGDGMYLKPEERVHIW
ncbi:M13 family metallopeptidase [Lactobacillus corticis]|uniref:Endopeptidase n=1 Tax=Lactobacillus corticis TaxID=2201249 RepID=A0A916VJC7_9LACO|nr:M13 family metallopeptidase [Lactobacillus corticis]GFZ27689.1 endopeptidase [Lactobacillus corticis]